MEWDLIDCESLVPHLVWVDEMSRHALDKQGLMKYQQVGLESHRTIITNSSCDNWNIG